MNWLVVGITLLIMFLPLSFFSAIWFWFVDDKKDDNFGILMTLFSWIVMALAMGMVL